MVVAISECQELFAHPVHGTEAGELCTAIIKRGRALGELRGEVMELQRDLELALEISAEHMHATVRILQKLATLAWHGLGIAVARLLALWRGSRTWSQPRVGSGCPERGIAPDAGGRPGLRPVSGVPGARRGTGSCLHSRGR
jgi:hypothetical protein